MARKTVTARIDREDETQWHLVDCSDAVGEFYRRSCSRNYKTRDGKLVNISRSFKNRFNDTRTLNEYRSLLSDAHRRIVALEVVKYKSPKVYQRAVDGLVGGDIPVDFMERLRINLVSLLAKPLFPPYLKMTQHQCRIVWPEVSELATRTYTHDLNEASAYREECSWFCHVLIDLLSRDRELKTLYINGPPSGVGCKNDRFFQEAVVKNTNLWHPYPNSRSR